MLIMFVAELEVFSLGMTRTNLLALLAEFAHDLCNVNWGVGGHLGPLLLLLLPDDDGAKTGPPVPGILLQLHFTEGNEKGDNGE